MLVKILLHVLDNVFNPDCIFIHILCLYQFEILHPIKIALTCFLNTAIINTSLLSCSILRIIEHGSQHLLWPMFTFSKHRFLCEKFVGLLAGCCWVALIYARESCLSIKILTLPYSKLVIV